MCKFSQLKFTTKIVIRCVIALVFFACIGNGFSCTQKLIGMNTMNENQQKALEIISLADEKYSNLSQSDVLSLQSKLTSKLNAGIMMAPPTQNQSSKPGLYALSAPSKVKHQDEDKITVLFASEESGMRRWKVDPKQNLQLALFDHQLKKLIIKRYSTMPDGKRQIIPSPSQSGEAPSAREQSTVLTSVQPIYLAYQFKDILHSGNFSLTVLMYNKKSNTVNFEISENEEAEVKRAGLTQAVVVDAVSLSTTPAVDISLDSFSMPTRTLRFSASAETLSHAVCKQTQKLHASLSLLKLDSASSFVIDMELSLPSTYTSENSLTWELSLADAISKHSLDGLYQLYLTMGKTWSPGLEIEIK